LQVKAGRKRGIGLKLVGFLAFVGKLFKLNELTFIEMKERLASDALFL
jgi:hypothetical protein